MKMKLHTIPMSVDMCMTDFPWGLPN